VSRLVTAVRRQREGGREREREMLMNETDNVKLK